MLKMELELQKVKIFQNKFDKNWATFKKRQNKRNKTKLQTTNDETEDTPNKNGSQTFNQKLINIDSKIDMKSNIEIDQTSGLESVKSIQKFTKNDDKLTENKIKFQTELERISHEFCRELTQANKQQEISLKIKHKIETIESVSRLTLQKRCLVLVCEHFKNELSNSVKFKKQIDKIYSDIIHP